MRRGTQGHVAAPRRPTRRRGDMCACYLYVLVLLVYNIYIAFRLSEGDYYLLKPLPVINPLISFNFSRVGLKSHTVFKRAGDVAKGEASDWMERGSSRVDWVYTWTTDRDQKHVRFKMDYNGRDWNCRGASWPNDRDPRGANSYVFITLIYAAHLDRSSRSDGHDLRKTVHNGLFHRNRRPNDRTVTPKCIIKWYVILMFKPFQLEFNLLELSRHLPSHFCWYQRVLPSIPHLRSSWNQDFIV